MYSISGVKNIDRKFFVQDSDIFASTLKLRADGFNEPVIGIEGCWERWESEGMLTLRVLAHITAFFLPVRVGEGLKIDRDIEDGSSFSYIDRLRRSLIESPIDRSSSRYTKYLPL